MRPELDGRFGANWGEHCGSLGEIVLGADAARWRRVDAIVWTFTPMPEGGEDYRGVESQLE